MRIFVCGCVHGSWERVVDEVNKLSREGTNIDLIIVAGDTESFIDEEDLQSFPKPTGTQGLGTFKKLVNGEFKLPCKMLIIGGNNEVGDRIFKLPFGGWITPDIFFSGIASQIYFGDLLITCQSGIFNNDDYHTGLTETFPVRGEDKYRIVHIREFSIFQLYGLKRIPLFVSHDWPSGIPKKFSHVNKLSNLVDSDRKNQFGCPGFVKLIEKFHPNRWYAAHHHRRFDCNLGNGTKFFGVPRVIQQNLYVLQEINCEPGEFMYSGEWIDILKKTEKYVKNPDILHHLNWDEEWKKIHSIKSDKIPKKVKVSEFKPEYQQQTYEFCNQHRIYNPYKM